jgi:hypothetical protein
MNKFSNVEHSLRTDVAIVEKSGMSLPVTLLIQGAIVKGTLVPSAIEQGQRQESIDSVLDQLLPSIEDQVAVAELKALAKQESIRIMSDMVRLSEDELDAQELLPQGEKLLWGDSFLLTNANVLFSGRLEYETPRLLLRYDAVLGIL